MRRLALTLAAVAAVTAYALYHGVVEKGGAERTRVKAYYVGMNKVAVTVVDASGRPLVGAPVEMKVDGRTVESSV